MRHPDLTPRRGATCLAAFGALAFLAGCGTPRLSRAPQPAVDLSGHWVLDTGASDDAAALIAAAVPKPRPAKPYVVTSDEDRPIPTRGGGNDGGGGHRGRGGGGGGERGGSAAPVSMAEPVPVWGRVSPKDFVAAFVAPPRRLDLSQSPTLVRLGAGDYPRSFEPGDEETVTVTDRYGSRAVRAGWLGAAFVINSKDGSRLDVTEALQRRADDRLERKVEFHTRGVKSLTVRAVYRRATSAELATAPIEGPPLPGAR